MNVAELRVRRQ